MTRVLNPLRSTPAFGRLEHFLERSPVELGVHHVMR